MKKIILMIVILGLVFGFSGIALAGERVEFEELRLTTVREEKINVLKYGATLGGWLEEVVKKLVESGEPSVVFKEQITPALEVTLIEGFLHRNVNLVGGATFENDEPVDFVWGGKYTGLKEKSGGIWDWFSKIQPAVYNVRGQWFLALVYIWRD